jgi:O-antigen/teichoic acid export membrane protein
MLAQKLVLSYSSRIIVQIVQIFASIVVARIAGPSVLGTLAFGMGYVGMLGFLADLGLGTAHIKKISEGAELSECLGTYKPLKYVLINLYFFGVIGFFVVQRYVFNVEFESDEHIYVIFIFLLVQVVGQLQSIPKTTFSAYTQQAKNDIPELIGTLLQQILRIILVVFGFRAIGLAWGNFATTILITPLIIFLFREYRTGKFNWTLAKEYFYIALPVMLTSVTSTMQSFLDIVLLQFFSNSEQVGYYSAGYRIGGFILLISQSVSLLFFPIFSQASKNKDEKLIISYVNRFKHFTLVFIMPILILVNLLSFEIVYLTLGDKFKSSARIMELINLAMFIRVLITPYSSVLVGYGFFKKGLKIGIIQFGFYLVILVLFLHPGVLNLGGIGAAIAICLGNLLMLLFYMFESYKIIPGLNDNVTLRYILVGLSSYSSGRIIFHYLNDLNHFETIILGIIIYIFVYLILYMLNLFTFSDFRYLRVIFDYKSLKKYIITELKKVN